MTTTDWDIQSRADACTTCRQPFADKQTYHTLLTLSPAEGYQRQDLCPICAGPADRGAGVSYWQAVYRVPPPPPPEAIHRNTAETMLRRLIESGDPADDGPRYILAVMLERKRLLKHRDTLREDDGKEILVYEHSGSGESFTLPDPHLRLDQLEVVQRQVAALLDPKPEAVAAEEVTADDAAGEEPA